MTVPGIRDIIDATPLALIGFIHQKVAARGSLLLVLSNLPITVMHELAHFLTALILGGKPTGFSIWPHAENGRWRLGSVTARSTIVSAAPTALAPLLWLLPGWLLFSERAYMADVSRTGIIGVYAAVYACLAAGIPSRQDIKIALTNPLSILLWGAVAAAADRFIG